MFIVAPIECPFQSWWFSELPQNLINGDAKAKIVTPLSLQMERRAIASRTKISTQEILSNLGFAPLRDSS